MKKNSVFLFSCLMSTALILSLYSFTLPYLQRDIDMEIRYAEMLKQNEKLTVENQLIKEKLEDVSMYALELIEKVNQSLPKNERMHELLKTNSRQVQLRSPASVKPLDMSEVAFKDLQSLIKAEKYVECVVTCDKFLQTNPGSARLVEVHYFLAESYYQLKEYKKSIEYIEKMMTLFPDHELTGFALLRMGQMSQMRSRQDEAVEIFTVIQKNYQNKFLKSQAATLSEKFIKQ